MATSPVAVARAEELLAPRSFPTVGRALWRFARKKPLGAAGAGPRFSVYLPRAAD